MAMINMIAVRARGINCSELLLQDLPSQGNLRIPTFFCSACQSSCFFPKL